MIRPVQKFIYICLIIILPGTKYAFSQAAYITGLPTGNQFCINDTAVLLTGYNPGGKPFIGPGITDNGNGTAWFDPGTAGIGTDTIVYNSGGSKVVTAIVTVSPMPSATLAPFSPVCANTPAFPLTGGSPSGGTYSGTGVDASGNFDPAVATPGTYTITYTDSVNTCYSSATQPITVNAVPTVTLAPFSTVCANTSPFALSGGSPSGGTYSGTGVSSNTFDPSVSGTGTFSITYTYSNGNCSDSATQNITVAPLPTVSMSGLASHYCQSDAPVTITGSPTDANGVFTGTGITDNGNGTAVFDPSTTGTGSFTITYTYTDANSCVNSVSQSVQVGTTLTLTGLAPAYCNDVTNVQIVANPTGGSYTAMAGLTDNADGTATFDPSAAGAGSYTVTYTYVGSYGCTNTINQNVLVNPPPTPDFSGLNSAYCANDAISLLTGNSAPSGSFSGSGVTDNGNGTANFDPSSLAAGGPYSVTYSYTDASTGCSASKTRQSSINPLPTATISGSATICYGSSTPINIALTGTSPFDFTYSDSTSSSSVTGYAGASYSTSVSPTTNKTYTVTNVTDANSCSNTGTGSASVVVNPQVSIVTDPTSKSICPGYNTSFSVTANGVNLTYQWQKNGTNISGATSSVLPLNSVTSSDAASYRCVVSSTCGGPVTSNSATLTLYNSTAITLQPVGTYLCTGNNLNLSVGATGSNLTYQWKKDGVALSNGGNIAGATSDVLVISSVTTANAGVYTCDVTGSCGTLTSNSATVNIDPPISITLQPSSMVGCPGDNISFTVNATGSSLTYQWQKNGTNIAGKTSQSLVINNISSSDAGDYTCVISSGCGQSLSSNTAILTVNTTTTISADPTDVTACTGSNASFSVTASGSSLIYQWYRGTVALSDGGGISGSNSDKLIITGVASGDAGSYTCKVTGSCGTLTSNPASLVVDDTIAITSQPTGQSVCQGNNASFTVTATGSNLSYQWQKGGTDLAGATNATLILNNVTSADAGNYRCILYNTCGDTLISSVAALTVNTDVTITSDPAGATECVGSSVGFTVAATGSGLSYQWYKDGAVLANSATVSGATTNSLFITNLSVADSGSYVCRVTGTCGFLNSNPAGLIVDDAITITSQPQSKTVCNGANVIFTVNATGSGVSYQWQKNGANIAGATSASLSLSSVSSSDTAAYRCVLTNTCGATLISSVADLGLYTTTAINIQPTDVTVCEGGGANFSVSATGSNLTYQWEKNGTATVDGANISGSATNTLALSSLVSADAGVYSCLVNGACGTQNSSPANLIVNTPTQITTQPLNDTVCPGNNAAFHVIASGSNLTYQWQKNGVDLAGETSDWLVLNGVTVNDTGTYRCVVAGDCGSQNSNGALLTVNTAASITQQPVNDTICEGQNASFAITATGSGLNYQWKFNNTTLTNGGNISGATTNILTISSATVADAGSYTCVVTGTCNTVTSVSGVLTVKKNITITSQPTNKTLCPTDNASFSVAATGANLTYQWQKDGTDIPGKTNSSLSIPNISSTDAGTYSCLITGVCGSVLSNGALLTVNQTTSITTQPVNDTICQGENAALNVIASGTNLTYQWSMNGTPLSNGTRISGSSTANLNIQLAQTSDAGLYTCQTTGTCGTVNSTSAQLIVRDSIAITQQPQNKTVCSGNNCTFTVSATGSNLTYQWQKNNVNIAGATGSSLSLTGVASGDAGNYRCIISSDCGNVISNAASLTVGENVAISVQPVNDTICEGGNSEFSITATGTGLAYQWEQNGSDLVDGGAFSGSNTFTLNISSASLAEAGVYTCQVTGLCSTENSSSASLIVNKNTSITSQPQNDTVCEGNTALFSIAATGSNLSYQWQKNGTDIPGETGTSYQIPSVVNSDAGIYRCVVTGTCGPITSNGASLTVNDTVVITTQPQATLATCTGNNFNLSVQVTGTGPSYQWRRNSTDLVNGGNISGVNTYTLTITSATTSNSGTYTCYITGSCNQQSSNLSNVTIYPTTSITQQPVDYTTTSGGNATFSVTAVGNNLTYQWEKDGVTLTDGGVISGSSTANLTLTGVSSADEGAYRCLVTGTCTSLYSNPANLVVNPTSVITTQPVSITKCEGNSASFSVSAIGAGLSYQWKKGSINLVNGTNISGATSPNLTIASVDTSYAGAYTCLVGTENSSPAMLTVNMNTMINTQPTSITRCEGDNAVFSVSASGSSLTYQWEKSGVALTDGGTVSGSSTNVLSITGVVISDTGTYRCVVSGACTTTNSDPAILTVNKNTQITLQPVGDTVCQGTSVTLNVVSGGSSLTYQWKKNGANLSDGGNITGSNTTDLILSNAVPGNSGAYSCTVSGTCGSKNSTAAQLIINPTTTITQQPVNISACEGDVENFTVVASGNNLTYQWQKNGTNLADGGTISGSLTANLTISGVVAADSGTFTCLIQGTCDTLISDPGILKVGVNTAITTQPVGGTYCQGSPLSLSVVASGTNLIYQWKKGGVALIDGSGISGSASANLNITNASLSDAGTYTCVVTGDCGTVNSNPATVTINPTTVITLQPVAESRCEGDNASFGITATGSGLTYQWQKDTVDLANTATINGVNTSLLTISGVALSDSGIYRCIVTGSCGTANSDPARLTVYKTTSITTQPVSDTLCSGSSITFSITADGDSLYYQWQKDGTALSDGGNITGSTTSHLQISPVSISDDGNYTCMVDGKCGTVNSTAATLQVDTITQITVQPVSMAACEGKNITFNIQALGTGLSYQWQKNGVNLSNGGKISGVTTNVLSIDSVLTSNAGTYQCVVSGTCGNITSNPASLSIAKNTSISLQPVDQVTCEGDFFSLTVNASGQALTYQWSKNNQALQDTGYYSGTKQSTLSVSTATTAYAGPYSCDITSTCGAENSSSALITVNKKTVITAQPQDVEECSGGTAVFTVSATGTNLTYQWQKSGVNLSDGGNIFGSATSILTVSSVASTDTGTYRCVITGQCGTVNSGPAVLTVDEYPGAAGTITGLATVCAGDSGVYYQVNAITNANTYVWNLPAGMNIISGAGTRTIEVSFDPNEIGGNITVYGSNSCGSGTVSPTFTVVANLVPVANAGPDQDLCASNTTLSASDPGTANGQWTVLNSSAVVQNANLYNSALSNLRAGDNILTWTVTQNGCSSSDTVVINNNSVTADAGTDQTICTDSIALNGSALPVGATGNWSIINGATTFADGSSPTSGASGFSPGINTLEWSVSRSGCTASDTVNINNQMPTTSNAGIDQLLCKDSTQLTAVNPTVGTGTWNVITGSATFANSSLYNSKVTGLGKGNNILRWTITNGICSSIDEVTITNNKVAVNAGPDQVICDRTTKLAAVQPATGSGSWSVVSGSGVFVDPGLDTTKVTGLAKGDNVLRWIVNNNGCMSSNDVTITNNSPTTSNAGPDQVVMTNSATLQGNIPVVGTGDWILVSGSASITDTGLYNTTVTNLGLGDNVFRWVISHNACTSTDDVTITNYMSTTTNAGPDQTLCTNSTQLDGSDPSFGFGEWSVVQGAATFADNSLYNTKVTNLGSGQNILRWTVWQNGYTSDDVVITNNTPSTANAGSDRTLCADSVSLSANDPLIGNGTWSVIGGSGNFSDSTAYNSTVTGLAKGENVFEWTITNKGCTSNDQVKITNDLPTTASAGSDQTICTDSTYLNPNTPTVGVGGWSVVSGSAIFNGNQAKQLAPGSNTLRWTITNNACSSSDDLVVTNNQPTTAHAGADKTLCANTSTLSANTPTIGTGTWTIKSGSAVFDNINKPNANLSTISLGTNIFRWTITNSGCSSYDEVTITNANEQAWTGPDQVLCGNTTVLEANNPSYGTGIWTVVGGSGAAVFNDPSQPDTRVSGLDQGDNVLQWTIQNSICTSSSEVTITNNTPTTAFAGPDQALCNDSVTLQANTPVIGTGTWSILGGSGTVASPNSPASLVTNLAHGPNTLRWTITNQGCTSTDEAVITNNSTTVSSAGADQTLCTDSTVLYGNYPSYGTGEWIIVSGSGSINDPAGNNSYVTDLGQGDNTFRWKISNGMCSSSDDVTITNSTPTLASAGADQAICSDSALLHANNPTIGTGKWSLVNGNGTFADPNFSSTKIHGLNPGDNTLRWTITNNSCESYDDVIINDQLPFNADAGVDMNVCGKTAELYANDPQGGTGTWTILSGTGTFNDPTRYDATISNLGFGKNTLQWSIDFGKCSTSDVVVVENDQADIYAGLDQEVNTSSTILAGSNPTSGTGSWSVIAGSGNFTDPNNSVTTVSNMSGGLNTFRWSVTINGCQSYDDVSVQYDVPPKADFVISKSAGCPPFQVYFVNNSLDNLPFVWNFGDGSTSQEVSTTHTYTKSGQYPVTLTVTGTAGEKITKDTTITVYDLPVASFQMASTDVYIPDEQAVFINTSTNATDYLWKFGDGSTSTDRNPYHTYDTEGKYNVSLIASSENQCVDTMTVDSAVTVIRSGSLKFPNAFTPSSAGPDGGAYAINDYSNNVFHPIGSGIAQYDLEIFNKWGVLLFESHNIMIGWDGYYRGRLVDEGAYVWKVTGKFNDGREFKKVGTVIVIHK